MAAHIQTLSSGWYWKERDASCPDILGEVASLQNDGEWTVAHKFPSEVHVELLNAGKIPDPFLGFNEHRIQWVGEKEWLYYSSFDTGESQGEHTELVFEGLDTICDAYLNGEKILSTDNMFRTYTVGLDGLSVKAQHNLLLLHFKPAKLAAKELEAKYGRVRAGSANLGDPSRVYIRKAQYGWRWDWGPEVMTCGPYRPIHLLTYTARLTDVHARAAVSAALIPSLNVDLTIGGSVGRAVAAHVRLRDSATRDVIKEELVSLTGAHSAKEDAVQWNLDGQVELWWPLGYGVQKLYGLEVTLLGAGDTVLDSHSQRIGFRSVELAQEPLREADRYGTGTTFLFAVNGVRVFAGGSNWIPAHDFLTELTPEKYRQWLTLMRDGNQNMVRLWGGGVYEPDVFYDTCDELGILVWQDFQFACGVYPAHDGFVQNVKAEAEDNVRRLRRHPSLAVFCGNNEDYQQVLQWGGIADLPARLIYESVLPSVVSALTDPPIPYHRGSPYGGKDWDTADPTVGDIHQWDIWAGKERPWQEYVSRGGRFVSEFGLPAIPDVRTVDYWLDGNKDQRWAQSKLMQQHNRAGNHERRFAVVMNENFRLTGDFETHLYNTQIMQSEGVGLAYRSWRREWRGKGKEYCAGVLVWQLNDCWPVTSWAIADYFLRPKPAYYTIARELAPISVGILRTVTKNRENDRPVQFYEFGAFRATSATLAVWGCNAHLTPVSVKLELRAFDLLSDWTYEHIVNATLHPNQSTELLDIPCPAPPPQDDESSPLVTPSYSVVVAVRLLDPKTGVVFARYTDWPQPFRHVDFPDPGLAVEVRGDEVSVSVDRPLKGLVLSADGEGAEVKWADNCLDVVPGDTQTLRASGLGGRGLRGAWMGGERPKKLV